jgi:major membrane immunogen (membrane-anchored lipoprotein)
MKKNYFAITAVLFLIIFSSQISSGQNVKPPENLIPDSLSSLKEGKYLGISRGKYIYEPFWGIVKFTIKDGRYTDISFAIRDSSLHEAFDAKYEKHFEGNPEYIQQSRNDWKGVQTYPKNLSMKQDINKLDAISGATWSYNIFRSSVKEAIKNPR